MKKLFLIIVLAALVAGCNQEAQAGEYDPCENSWKSKVYNECADNSHGHKGAKDPAAGVGGDIVLWKNDGENDKLKRLEEFVAEYRHDFNNQSNSIYGVVRVDASDVIPGFFAKIKSIFNRGGE